VSTQPTVKLSGRDDPMDKLPYVFDALQKIEAGLSAKIRVRP
jgi:hypothetical protein